MQYGRQQERSEIIPEEAYQLTQHAELGTPLAASSLPKAWQWFFFTLPRLLLVLCGSLFLLTGGIEIVLFLHLQTVQTQSQSLQLQGGLAIGLLWLVLVFPGTMSLFWFMLRTNERRTFRTLIACQHGLLCIAPQHCEIVRWDEVTDFLSLSKRHYTLLRSQKKRVAFGSPLTDIEAFAELVSQQSHTPLQTFHFFPW